MKPKSSRAGFVKLHSSPAAVLDTIAPPGCKISLNYNDRRWVSSFAKNIECQFWIEQYAPKSFTRRFDARNWKQKLSEVHSHSWRKWDLNRAELALAIDQQEQLPGEVPMEALDSLAAIVRDLPEPKVYK